MNAITVKPLLYDYNFFSLILLTFTTYVVLCLAATVNVLLCVEDCDERQRSTTLITA